MMKQCPMCLSYSEKLVELCDECQDKAAKFDITASERETLGKAIQEVLPTLNELAPSYAVGEIIGRLTTVLKNCRFDVAVPAKGE